MQHFSINQNTILRPIKKYTFFDQSKRLNLSTNQNAVAYYFNKSERNIISTNQNVYIFRPIRMQYCSEQQSTTKIQREMANHNAAFFDRIYISNHRRAVFYT